MSASLFAQALAAIPAPDPGPEPVATNAEKARALMAMLDPKGGTPEGVAPDRLRDWARDLIQTVEGGTAAAPKKARQSPGPRLSLFSKGAPTLRPLPDPPPAASAPTLAPKVLEVAEDQTFGAKARAAAVLEPSQVQRLVRETLDETALAREHPAVIALTLLGRPSRDQAAALRALHGSQVRAVHRALRQMEQGPMDSGQTGGLQTA